jgi:DNA-binding IclR family transcriptional regulator
MEKDVNLEVVPAVQRALDIFEYLGNQNKPMTLKEISIYLQIPSVSTFRIVKYLCSRGYLKEDSNVQGRYSLGFQLLHLAHLMSKCFDLSNIGIESMRKLAEESGQTAQLAVLQENGVMYINQILPQKPVNIIAALRTVLSVNISASGKVLVAYLEAKEQEEFLKKIELERRTPNSIFEKEQFYKELQAVREKGFGFDNEEYARGIGCLAAPIFDYTGKNVAAVGITGQISDYQDETNLKYLKRLVLATAQEISASMGYQ